MALNQVITELDVGQLKALQLNMTGGIIIIKFGAEWCGPCKKIAPLYTKYISSNPMNILFCDIDVDTSLDLYIALKKQKMITGIPVFLAFFGDVKRENWFIPDDSVIGADEKEIDKFFKRCSSKALGLLGSNYTYYS
jgi:thioredoxin 1